MSDEDAAILKAIQDLRSDVIHELQEQRKLWGEAEGTLLAQGKLHKERLDAQQERLEDIERRVIELERATSIPSPPDNGHLDG